jgi:hypothetical protein
MTVVVTEDNQRVDKLYDPRSWRNIRKDKWKELVF